MKIKIGNKTILCTRRKDHKDFLFERILELRAEKKEQSDYLIETTTLESGSLQLRKTWPASLHKYLPPEPIKLPKKSKGTGTNKTEVYKPKVPDSLNTRLTENLLEGT